MNQVRQRGPRCECSHPVEDHTIEDDGTYSGACRWTNCKCREFGPASEKKLKKDAEQTEKRELNKMLRLLRETPCGMMNCNDVKFLTNWITLSNEKDKKAVVRLFEKYISFETLPYTMCKHCDHFVDSDTTIGDSDDETVWDHLEDGEQEFDHNAEPSMKEFTLAAWRERRPDLFTTYDDGKTGPNSVHHSRRGKKDEGAEDTA